MQSGLTASEFKNTLKSTIKNGNPIVGAFSLFRLFSYDSSKPFNGVYDDSSFILRLNMKLSDEHFYKLKGTYKMVNGKLQVRYSIFPEYKYQRILGILGLLPFTAFLIYINIKHLTQDNRLVINLFCILMISYAFWNISRARKKLEKKFIETFELYS